VHEEIAWMTDLVDAAVREDVLPALPIEFLGVMILRVLNGIVAVIEAGEVGMSDDEVVAQGLAMLWKTRTGADPGVV
jgi:hypothetical protein